MNDEFVYKRDVQQLICRLNSCVGAIRNIDNCEKRCPDFKAVDELPSIKNNKTSKNPVVKLEDELFGAVLNCAVRYAMGRQSYMPGLVIDFITPLLPYISTKTLAVFKQDYESNARDEERTGWNMFGDPKIDKPGWDKFYIDVLNELSKRTEGD